MLAPTTTARVPDIDAPNVARAATGEARAFETLYRKHVPRIHSLARRMVGPEEADEVTQDVFVRAWEKLGTFRGDSAFGTWLYRLAINVILSRRASQHTREARHEYGEEAFSGVHVRPASAELRVDFENALAELPDGARQVFVLHDVEGYKHEEIAELLEITAGTSKSQLHRARMILRTHLTR